MKVFVIFLFAISLPMFLCKSINSTSVLQTTNGTQIVTEEFNIEIDIPKCNDTNVKSFVVDLHFSLKPETAPMLIGKLIQSCSYYMENNVLIHDIFKLIKLDGISFIEFVEWIKEILPNNIVQSLLETTDELDSKEIEELTEIEFLYFKKKLITLTENVTYCQFLEENEWFGDIFAKLWKVSDAFSITFLDIMRLKSFSELFMQYYTDINDLSVSGVFIDSKSLVTNGVIYQKLITNQEYVKLVGITLENCKRYEFTNMEWINSHLVKLQSNHHSESYINYNIAKSDVLNDCIYMLKHDDEIKVINFEEIENQQIHLVAQDVEKVWFKVGNPLICNNTLYGLAEFQSMFGLNFASFYEKQLVGSAGITTCRIGYVAILMFLAKLM